MNALHIIVTVIAMNAGKLILSKVCEHADNKYLENIMKEHIVLRPSAFFPIFGVFMILLDVALTIGLIRERPSQWGFPLICNVFCLGCGIPLLLRANVKIEFNKSEDYFDYRSMFRRRHRIYYCEITDYRWNIQIGGSEVYLKTAGRTYHIELTGMEQYSFIGAIKQHKMPNEKKRLKKSLRKAQSKSLKKAQSANKKVQ